MADTSSIFQDSRSELSNWDFNTNFVNYTDEENFSTSVLLMESNEQTNEKLTSRYQTGVWHNDGWRS